MKFTFLLELTFWLFMLHQGPIKRAWFDSWEVKVWYIGPSPRALCVTVSLTHTYTRLHNSRFRDAFDDSGLPHEY